jgi:hypothetical protein
MRQPNPKGILKERHVATTVDKDGKRVEGDVTETYLLPNGQTEQFVNGKFTVESTEDDGAENAPAETPVDSVKSGPVTPK